MELKTSGIIKKKRLKSKKNKLKGLWKWKPNTVVWFIKYEEKKRNCKFDM